jgi:hypothetical protein
MMREKEVLCRRNSSTYTPDQFSLWLCDDSIFSNLLQNGICAMEKRRVTKELYVGTTDRRGWESERVLNMSLYHGRECAKPH